MEDRSTHYNVTANGRGTMAPQTFREAVGAVALAAKAGQDWDVTVRGPDDSAYRYLTTSEAARLVAAVRDRMETPHD